MLVSYVPNLSGVQDQRHFEDTPSDTRGRCYKCKDKTTKLDTFMKCPRYGYVSQAQKLCAMTAFKNVIIFWVFK